MRNQKIVNVTREDDFDSHDQEECSENSENSEDDVVATAGAALEFPEEFQENHVEENTLEDDIISCAANEKHTFSGRIIEDRENISIIKQEFDITNLSLENLKPRRSRVRYPANSLHYERLMKVVSSERSKHREIINSVTNTTFALSRRPLPHKHFKPRLRKTSPEPSPPSIKRKSVRFGNLITFDDNSTPVPVRPPRKKSHKSPRLSSSSRTFSNQAPTLTRRRGLMSSNDTVDSFDEEDITPEKPRRAYKGREVTPLSEALQPLHDRHLDLALENIKSVMKAARQNIKDQNKKRSVLSSLNLFLCLAYERLRDPTFLTPELRSQDSVLMIQHRAEFEESCNQSDVSRKGVVSPKSRREVPTAIQQLKGVQEGRLYLRNIPNLLLFNLIHGRSL